MLVSNVVFYVLQHVNVKIWPLVDGNRAKYSASIRRKVSCREEKAKPCKSKESAGFVLSNQACRLNFMAESVRFELTVQLPVQRFSRPSHSTTLATFQYAVNVRQNYCIFSNTDNLFRYFHCFCFSTSIKTNTGLQYYYV